MATNDSPEKQLYLCITAASESIRELVQAQPELHMRTDVMEEAQNLMEHIEHLRGQLLTLLLENDEIRFTDI